MTTKNFAACFDIVLRHEGGYADHPSDPGGATNMGITRKTLARWRRIHPWWQLSKAEVKALGRDEAARIYKAQYWDRVAGNLLPDGLDLALFDFAVNSGPATAVKVMQRDLKVRVDGALGPITLGAIRDRARRGDLSGMISGLCTRRLAFLKRLKTFSVFGRGWTTRVAAIRRAALALAGANTDPKSTTRRPNMDILSGYKTYLMATLMLLAGIAQALGVDVPGFDGQSTGHLIMEAFAIIFLRKGLKSDISNA